MTNGFQIKSKSKNPNSNDHFDSSKKLDDVKDYMICKSKTDEKR
jgi:hypothetical protein